MKKRDVFETFREAIHNLNVKLGSDGAYEAMAQQIREDMARQANYWRPSQWGSMDGAFIPGAGLDIVHITYGYVASKSPTMPMHLAYQADMWRGRQHTKQILLPEKVAEFTEALIEDGFTLNPSIKHTYLWRKRS